MGRVSNHSKLTEFDIYLFRKGKHRRLYEKLGSHPMTLDGQAGVYFAVWAPHAMQVAVIGVFNYWDINAHQLYRRIDDSGIWEGFIPGIGVGTLYKYFILAPDGRPLEKGDPFALYWENPPKTASIVWDLQYDWKDSDWMTNRKHANSLLAPMSVYEVHLGSWRKKPNLDSLSYRELADELVNYVTDMGYTHAELLPVMEHPYYPSWGYQITGYYAPTSRFGMPQDFMYLMDAFHQAGVGVILDWVPSHFPSDAHGLAEFDGTHLFEHPDPRRGYHPDWKSYVFNYELGEVRSYLISNALFWLDRYHADGLRVDAVASMLYLDYSKQDTGWLPNQFGGREYLEAISFLREFNEAAYAEHPDIVTIAEESTAWPKVSHPTYDDGLGFGQKWMMGWMHDTLAYFKEDPINRKFHHHRITFSIIYAFHENFMKALSHDEVVHLKKSLLEKMPGDDWQKFANLRLLYGYMFTHPGTNLLFMGAEFGQRHEWSEERGLDWHLLDQKPLHSGLQSLIRDLNKLYRGKPALYEYQFKHEGFEWIDLHDVERSIIVYLRKATPATKPLLVVCNFTPMPRENYRIGVPYEAEWTEILNTDSSKYGGRDILNSVKQSEKAEMHNQPQSIVLLLPPLATLVFEPDRLPPLPVKSARAKKSSAKKQGKEESIPQEVMPESTAS
jgi:1,4-alpha-glucan branching enzyme